MKGSEKMKKLLSILLVLMLATAIFAGCAQKDTVVKIGHKNYSEQRLTGQMMAVIIEDRTGYETEVVEFGGTMLCWEALKSGEIDAYPEFTGTAYGAIIGESEVLGQQETYDYVKQVCEDEFGITWLGELGWNNTYVLSVTKETAKEYGLETVSDLVEYAPEMVIGCDNEFQGRIADGLVGMKEKYGLTFKEEVPMDQGLTYAALRDGDLDVNVSFSTDGRIALYDLFNLQDDLNFFPPYYVAPILRMEYVDEHPEVVDALSALSGQFTDEEMQQLNLRVDEGETPYDVAVDALTSKGLIG
jgi:glycine betaine/choline ABC-type transport system substrate-binding protein